MHDERINGPLKEYIGSVADLPFRELAAMLYTWAARFTAAFALGLQTPASRIDWIRGYAYGTDLESRNGFALAHEITINARYIGRPLGQVLNTLLHERLSHSTLCA